MQTKELENIDESKKVKANNEAKVKRVNKASSKSKRKRDAEKLCNKLSSILENANNEIEEINTSSKENIKEADSVN